jgi:hypothetical protein
MNTNDKLADALECFWNAALGATRTYDDATANAVMSGMVQGVAAVATRLRELDAASLAAPPAQGEWQPIETAPRDSSAVLVAFRNAFGEWRVREVWWSMPFEGAPVERCWWCYDKTGTLLDASVHGVGASHWMPLPLPPSASPQPAPAPVQADVLGELADEIEATYPNADASNLRAFGAQPPAPGEAEVCDHAEVNKLVEFFRKEGYMRFGLNGDNMGWSPAETAIRAMREYMQKETAIASQLESRNAD